MNIYIRDNKINHLYARIRKADADMYAILHAYLCQTGCIALCMDNRYLRPSCYTIYVNDIYPDMDAYVKYVVRASRLTYNYNRLRLGVN